MKLLHYVLPSILACTMLGAAETPPLMSLTIGDGARMIKRFEASIYAKLWQDRSMEAMRLKFAEGIAEIEKKSGINPLDVIRALRSCDLQFTDFAKLPALPVDPLLANNANNANNAPTDPQPILIAQADLGEYAAQLMALILKSDEDSERITIPGADEAIGNKPGKDPAGKYSIARYGSRLVVGMNQVQPPSPYTITTDEADLVLALDYKRFVKAMSEQAQDDQQKAVFDTVQKMEQFLQPFTWDMTILPEGIRERMTQNNAYPGLIPVDRALFSHLPTNTQMAYSMGFDSKAYWNLLEPMMIDLLAAQGTPLTPAQIKKQVEDTIAQFGLPLTYDEVKQFLTGTILVSVSPGAPIPSLTLALPRSKALDALISVGANMQQLVLPEEGKSGQVSIPNVPLPITVIRSEKYWVLSSDPQIETAWNAKDGGWSTSVAVKTAFEQAPDSAVVIGASDTPTVLRAAGGFLPFIPFTDPKDKQLATVLLARAAGHAATGYIFATSSSDKWTMEARGIFGFGFSPIIAAIAIPALMKTRTVANESAAAASLKSGVFPAQIQFQAGNYADQNGDNIGEFGFLSEMSGGPLSDKADDIRLNLLPNTWNATYPSVNGYTFACWLPDANGGAIGAKDGPRAKDAKAAPAQSRSFVVYAWPNDGEKYQVFALTQAGVIYSKSAIEIDITENGPAWNALFDGMGWDAMPTWTPYKK